MNEKTIAYLNSALELSKSCSAPSPFSVASMAEELESLLSVFVDFIWANIPGKNATAYDWRGWYHGADVFLADLIDKVNALLMEAQFSAGMNTENTRRASVNALAQISCLK